MIFITKTNDLRCLYLKLFLEHKNKCLYQEMYNGETDIDEVVLPFDGIDQFGYIKHTNIKLEKMLEKNQVKIVYTGKVNNVLQRLSKLYEFKVYSFYDDLIYLKQEFLIKIDVIKCFVEDKLNMRFDELRTLVLGNDYKAYLLSEKLNCDIYDKGSVSNKSVKEMLLESYDVLINSNFKISDSLSEKLVIDMNEIEDLDLSVLLSCRNVYFINQLLSQYLTKSGGKIMYDRMVNR